MLEPLFQSLANLLNIQSLQLKILIIMFFAAMASSSLMPVIIRMARKYKLLDRPDERKQHKSPIPALGGVGVTLALLASTVLWIEAGYELMMVMAAAVLLFFLGLWDDLKDLSAKKRFLFQFAIAILVASQGVRISSLYGILGIHELPLMLSYIITVFVIVGLINATNLIDGLDGLLGGFSTISITFFGLILFIKGEHMYALFAFALLGAIMGFMRYNYHPAKIFMGDNGSVVIGFLLAVLGIKILPANGGGNMAGGSEIILVFATLWLPVFDTLRLIIVRAIKNGSPFKADRNHVHHLLLGSGLNHAKSSWVIYCTQLLLVMLSILLYARHINIMLSLVMIVVSAVILFEGLTLLQIIKWRKVLTRLGKQKEQLVLQNRLLKRNL